IPTGVISAGFVDYYTRLKRSEGEIRVSSGVNHILQIQAAKAGLQVDTYVELLILDKEKERKEKAQTKNKH
ncbi:MAG: hypothetical protein J6Z22_04220, partial [Lachnospiraceae bacterium]|nr:hypothetical protein [Lachnospiraceae bacterium]